MSLYPGYFKLYMHLTISRIIWQNGTAGGCHFDDFWPLVAEKVHVRRGEVKLLSGKEMYLDGEDSTHFPCNVVLCGTGWRHGLAVPEGH